DRAAALQAELHGDRLAVSRRGAGRTHIEFVVGDLRPVVGAALDGIRPAAAAKDLRLTSSLVGGVTVWGDAIRLRQVVSNLLSNAVKFTPAGGFIEGRLQREGTTARGGGRDEGVGGAPEVRAFVFRPFPQG